MADQVLVTLRGLVVGNLDLGPSEDGVGDAFVGTPEPLPVGTMVSVAVNGSSRPARVSSVVEREANSTQTPGMHLRWEDAASAPKGKGKKKGGRKTSKGMQAVAAPVDDPPTLSPEVIDEFHTTRYGESAALPPPRKKKPSKKK